MANVIDAFTSVPGLICAWDFAEPAGEDRVSSGPNEYRLCEMNGPITRGQGITHDSYAADLKRTDWFRLPREECPDLDIHGPEAAVTVAAWVKRRKSQPAQCEAIAGMWNETERNRQYCLFLNLQIWDSADQVCGHVSGVGGPTEGYEYCMDAAIGQTPVPFGKWQFVVFTYDGTFIKAYLNGELDCRADRNPYRYEQGLYDPGDCGADFTVGGVHRSNEMGNWFCGAIGGLAVYDRALSADEIATMYTAA